MIVSMPAIEISCRAIVILNNSILLCKQAYPVRDFWTLPGGALFFGEKLEDCLRRELHEELGVDAIVEKLSFVRELIELDRHRIEFYYSVKCSNDFLSINLERIRKKGELSDCCFWDIKDMDQIRVKPECLKIILAEHMLNTLHDCIMLGRVR